MSRKEDPGLVMLWQAVLLWCEMQRLNRSLTARQLALLVVCSEANPSPSVGSLAEYLDIPSSAVTRALDRLVATRLVTRRRDKRDRRVVRVLVTDKGRRFVANLRSALRRQVPRRRN